MRHKKMAIKISEMIDGRLSAHEEQAVQAHLKQCAACREMHSRFMLMRSRKADETNIKVQPFFVQRVLNGYDNRSKEKIWQAFDFFPRPVVATGLTLALMLFIFFAIPVSEPSSSSLETEFALLFNGGGELQNVSDDEALAIVLEADSMQPIGE